MEKELRILDAGCGKYPKNLHLKHGLLEDVKRIFQITEDTRAKIIGVDYCFVPENQRSFQEGNIVFERKRLFFDEVDELSKFNGILWLNPEPQKIFNPNSIIEIFAQALKEKGRLVITTEDHDLTNNLKTCLSENSFQEIGDAELTFNSVYVKYFSKIYEKI